MIYSHQEVNIIEKRIGLTVRVHEDVAREFKIQCAIEGVTGQEILEQAIKDFIEKSKKKSE